MKKSQRIAGFFCAAGMIAPLTTPAFAAEQAAPVKAHAEMADAFIQVEDTFAAFLDGNGRSRTPVAYDNTIYIPLRTVGEWMGGDAAWDQASQTVHLTSGVREPFYLNIFTPEGQPDATEEEDVLYAYEEEHGMEVELRPDIKVTINGTEQTFRNAAGKTVYPLVLRECVYLPVRNIGELCGKSVLWHANPDGTMETVYLYDPPTDGQIQEAQAYLDRFARDLAAMEQALTDMKAKTAWSEEAFRAQINADFYQPLTALTELTAPALAPTHRSMDGLRLQSKELLDNTVKVRMDPEQYMKESARAEYLAQSWQSHRDDFVRILEKQLGGLGDWLEYRRLDLAAVIHNRA